VNAKARARALKALDRIDRDRGLVMDLIAPRDEHGERQYPIKDGRYPEGADEIRRGTTTIRRYLGGGEPSR